MNLTRSKTTELLVKLFSHSIEVSQKFKLKQRLYPAAGLSVQPAILDIGIHIIDVNPHAKIRPSANRSGHKHTAATLPMLNNKTPSPTTHLTLGQSGSLIDSQKDSHLFASLTNDSKDIRRDKLLILTNLVMGVGNHGSINNT